MSDEIIGGGSGGGGGSAWGDITGTLADQTDLQSVLNNKVDVDGSKVLSDNNYSTTEKNKLAGLEAGWATKMLDSDFEVTSSTSFSQVTGLYWSNAGLPDGQGLYAVRGKLFVDNSATTATGLKVLFSGFASTSMVSLIYTDKNNPLSVIHKDLTSNSDPFFSITGSYEFGDSLEIEGIVDINSPSRDIEFLVGQRTSNVNPVVVRAGSYIEIKKVD